MTLTNNLLEHFAQEKNDNFLLFQKLGFPSTKNEEWKYTSVNEVVNNDFQLEPKSSIALSEIESYFISKAANNIVFINGIFNTEFSQFNTEEISIANLESSEFKKIASNFQNYKKYNADGFVALNDFYASKGIFINIFKSASKPIYIHHFIDCKSENILSIPKISVSLSQNIEATFIEIFHKIGTQISLTNANIEFLVLENAICNYYKILDEGSDANHIGTTQFNQIGKSKCKAFTLVMSGNIVRNNLNFDIEQEYSESHLFGLNLLSGKTHVDNHTVVDHAKPNCESNELYKSILDEESSSVFNGKIFVRQDAQKTNAYQSSKNILLSNNATAYSKPQLEIWADDVKCSHGHATGQLNKEHLFYLKARGIGEREAMKMLTKAYAQDILNSIEIEELKAFCEEKINSRFEK